MNQKVLEILNLIETLDDVELKKALEEYYEPDIADALEELDLASQERVRNLLSPEMHSEVLSNLEDSSEYVETLDDKKLASIVNQMDSNEARTFLDSLEEDRKEIIESLVDDRTKKELALLDNYEDDEVGQYINTDFVLIDDSYTIAKAMRKVIEMASKIDDFTEIYVNNQEGIYRGSVSLRELIIARKDADFVELIRENYPVLKDRDRLTDVKDVILEYGLDSYPIVSSDGIILGILTNDSAREIVEADLQEDFSLLGGVSNSDLNEKPFKAVIKRLPWLIVLLVVAIGVSMVASSFEGVIASLVTVVFFQSMTADMAGNVGTQALAIVIGKDFKQKEDKKEKRKTLLNEVAIGSVNGIVLGILGCLVVVLVLLIMGKSGDVLWRTGLTVGLSLFTVSALSSFIGAAVPLLLIKIGLDPAVVSGPFITTFNDILAVVSYFGFAYLIFYIL